MHADVAYLSERAAAAPTVEAPTASESDTEARQSASGTEGQMGAEAGQAEGASASDEGDQARARRQGSAAAPGAETEQLGLFGDTAQDAEEGPGDSAAAAGSEAVSDDEAPAQPENSREAQLRAALIEGETIDRVSFTDLREPAAGWIVTRC